MLRAAVYVRISMDHAGEGLGVARQEADCRALVARNGWSVAEVYDDNDRSAAGKARRPAYARMLEDMARGVFDVIVVYHHDRLNRSPRELEHFIDLCQKYAIDCHTVASGSYDLSTASGRGMARIAAAMAKMEIDRQGERAKRKSLERAMNGYPTSIARHLYGYEPDNMTVRPFEAAQIVRAYNKMLAGASILSIRSDLRAASPERRWTWQMTRNLLTRPHYAGIQMFNGEVLRGVTPQWTQIVEPEVFHAVQALVAKAGTAGRKPGRHPTTYLTGIARCGVCGDRVGVHQLYKNEGARRAIYACCYSRDEEKYGPRKGHPGRNMNRLDLYVERMVIARLSRSDMHSALTTPRVHSTVLTAARAQVMQLEARLADAADAYAAGEISRSQMAQISQKLSQEIATLTPRTAPDTRPLLLEGMVGTKEHVQQRWSTLSMERKRDVTRSLLDVQILPRVQGRRHGVLWEDEQLLTWL